MNYSDITLEELDELYNLDMICDGDSKTITISQEQIKQVLDGVLNIFSGIINQLSPLIDLFLNSKQ